MSNGKLLRQLIRSGAEGDFDTFRGFAQASHRRQAAEAASPAGQRPRIDPVRPLSIPRLSSAAGPDRHHPQGSRAGHPPDLGPRAGSGFEDVVLSLENLSAVKEILREHNREEVLRAHGLRASDRLLPCGPPGCGKTLTAEVIAKRARPSPGGGSHGQRGVVLTLRDCHQPSQGI